MEEKKKHKWLKRGLCALLVLAMGVARADDDCDDCYAPWWSDEEKNGVTWSYYEEDGEAVIIGASPIRKSLVIPSELGELPVCVIDDGAFEDADKLESVTIPESVRTIGEDAFADCPKLSTIFIGAGVERIDSAFEGCSALKTIKVDPENECLTVDNGLLLTTAGDAKGLVRASSSLASVVIPADVVKILPGAFSAIKGLKSVLIPESVELIGKKAFEDCTGLTSVTIPGGVKAIGEDAFEDCSKLNTIVIGAGVELIGESAFGGCSALKTIRVDSTNKYFTVDRGLLLTTHGGDEGESLVRASSSLVSVVIPEGVVNILTGAFAGIKGFKSVSIPEGVELIGEKAFEACAGLTSMTIPNSVWTIGRKAFADCSKLNTIVIGAGVELIGEDAFAGCKGLKKVVFNGNRPYYDYWDNEEYDDDEWLYEYLFEDVPSSCVIFVQEESNWSEYYEIPGTWHGHKIRYSLQIGCEGLERGSFTAGVKGDDEGVYLDLPDNVKSVSVKGLPAGMKLTKVTDDGAVYWMISGAPTKSGTFTATISVTTQDGTKDDKSITFTVDAISPMAVGTFKGFIVNDDGQKCGTVQFTTTAAGKLSAKVVTASGTYSFSASAWDSVGEDGIYYASVETKKGEYLAIELKSASDLNQKSVSGFFVANEDSDGFLLHASRNLLGKTWYFSANVVGDDGGWMLEEVYDAKAANLTLSMKGDGTTALKGKLDATSVNASGFADFSAVEGGRIIAEFAPVVSVREGKKSVKKTLSISLDLPFSQEEGASGSADLVE